MVLDIGIDPLFDRVFVKKDDDEFSKGGLVLPQSVKGRMEVGAVIAVGPGMRSSEDGRFIAPCVKVGDRVFVKAFSGYTIRHNDEEVHVFVENEIIGIIRDVVVEEESGE